MVVCKQSHCRTASVHFLGPNLTHYGFITGCATNNEIRECTVSIRDTIGPLTSGASASIRDNMPAQDGLSCTFVMGVKNLHDLVQHSLNSRADQVVDANYDYI